MRKVVPFLVVGLLGLLYSSVWVYQSNNAKRLLESSIKELDDSLGTLDIKYDSIESKGFPFNMELSINNPEIKIQSGDINRIIKIIRKEISQDNYTSWTDTLSISGSLNIESNIFGSEYNVSNSGDINLVTEVDGEKSNYRIKNDPSSYLSVKLFDSKLSGANDADKDESVIYKIKEILLSEHDIEFENVDDKITLAKSEKLFANIKTNQTEPHKEKRFEVSYGYSDTVFSDEFDYWYMELPGSDGVANSLDIPFSKQGVSNFSTSMVYDGFIDQESFRQGGGKIRLDISSLIINNDLENFSGGGVLDVDLSSSRIIPPFEIKWHLENTINEKKYQAYLEQVKKYQEKLSRQGVGYYEEQTDGSDIVSLPSLGEMMRAVVKMEDSVDMLVPKIYENGKIKLSIDASYVPQIEKDIIKINKLDFNQGEYDLSINGDVFLKDGFDLYGELKISMNRYEKMVDNITGYFKSVLAILKENDPRYYSFTIKEGFADEIKGFLKAVSDYPALNDPDISLTLRKAENETAPSMATMKMSDILGLYNDKLIPFLKVPKEEEVKLGLSGYHKNLFSRMFYALPKDKISNVGKDIKDLDEDSQVETFKQVLKIYKEQLKDGNIEQSKIIPKTEVEIIDNYLNKKRQNFEIQVREQSTVKEYFRNRYGENNSSEIIKLTQEQVNTLLKIRLGLSDDELVKIYVRHGAGEPKDLSKKQRLMIFKDMVSSYKSSLKAGNIKGKEMLPENEVEQIEELLDGMAKQLGSDEISKN